MSIKTIIETIFHEGNHYHNKIPLQTLKTNPTFLMKTTTLMEKLIINKLLSHDLKIQVEGKKYASLEEIFFEGTI